MPRKRDESRVAEAARLYATKISPARIAEQLGVNRRTVQRWLGDDVRTVGAPKNPAVPDAKILDLRDKQGKSYREIAALTGMSVTGVRTRYWSLSGRERPERRT